MKVSTLESIIRTGLDATAWPNVYFYPGPEDPDLPAGDVVVLTADGGAGLIMDGALDNKSYQVKVSGDQNSFDRSEDLAQAIDRVLLTTPGGRYGGVFVASIYRVGGAPSPLVLDEADRTQFVCSYFFDVESTLPPL